MRIHTSGREYLRAAKDLFEGGWSDSTPPILFLIGQSLELSLKAFLRGSGYSDPQLRGIGHDIEQALSKAREHGLGKYCVLSEEELQLVTLISRPYRAKDLQYVKTGLKERPAVEPSLELATRINAALKGFCLSNKDLHVGTNSAVN